MLTRFPIYLRCIPPVREFLLAAAALFLAGCSGGAEEPAFFNAQQPSQSPQQSPQQQGQPGAITQPRSPEILFSSDVCVEQVQKATRISMPVRMGTQEDRRTLRKDMQAKHSNSQVEGRTHIERTAFDESTASHAEVQSDTICLTTAK